MNMSQHFGDPYYIYVMLRVLPCTSMAVRTGTPKMCSPGIQGARPCELAKQKPGLKDTSAKI